MENDMVATSTLLAQTLDNPNVQAMFKALAKMSFGFECDPRRTILIDDSSYKGCVSPANNCIFPMMFDEKKKMDNVLMGELLPYLLKLDEARDVRTAIEYERQIFFREYARRFEA
ncbi:hypothetical protein L7F22_031921, partial [Adiantum nelumboides]|nr:hypothetical protein [Adiantum nelumboides]